MAPGSGGSRSAPRKSARSHTFVGGIFAAATVVGTLWLWTNSDLVQLEDTMIRQDARATRFSQHCLAESPDTGDAEGAPGAAALAKRGWLLRRIVVAVSHGDSSPYAQFNSEGAGGDSPQAFWSCRPRPLPRHWGVNEELEFETVTPKGKALERSFSPELLQGAQLKDFVAAGAAQAPDDDQYVCGPGQLTGEGFHQMVSLGRRLAQAYGSALAPIFRDGAYRQRASFRSLDEKRSLASLVGLLMSLSSEQLLDDKVTITVDANASRDPLRLRGLESDLGDHLLARWCHGLPWPCSGPGASAAARADRECMSLEQVALLVQKGEAEVCAHLGLKTRQLLAEVLRALQPSDAAEQDSKLLVLSTDGPALAGLLDALLDGAVCRGANPLRKRPPYASRLVLERWDHPSVSRTSRWRALWNGEDISRSVPGCAASASEGGAAEEGGLEGCRSWDALLRTESGA